MRVEPGADRWKAPAWLACFGVFAVAWLGQWLLATNPGYFSHDELQWAFFAERAQPVSWLAIDAFQYRPLTFNLWMALSRALFDSPQAFHSVLVAWGCANAVFVYLLARQHGIARWPAAAAAWLFALGPFSAHVHGWAGTIGDLAWGSCALLSALAVRKCGAWPVVALVVGLLTLVGLLAKEAAVAIPPLMAVGWWLDRRDTRWAAAAVASGAVVAAYLALRLGVLLGTPRVGDQYTVSLASVPWRWLEYQLYPALPGKGEIAGILQRGVSGSLLLSGVLWGVLVAALARAGWRPAALWLAGGIAALAPVLPMASSWNQYGYGFAAVGAIAMACAWARAPRWARAVIVLYAVVVLWHGVAVMQQVRAVGEVQSNFSPGLARMLAGCTPGAGLRVRAAHPDDHWMFARLTHDIPAYAGVAMGDRVALVAAGEAADVEAGRDGRVALLPGGGCEPAPAR